MEQIAKRALEAFLSLTAGNSDGELALRALVLHMLEGYKPEAFKRWKLAPLMQETLPRLSEVSITFPKELSPDDALARVDAIYILHHRNFSYVLPQLDDFFNYLLHLDQNGFGLYAWVMTELMKSCGLSVPIVFHDRPFKSISRLLDTYWVTHLYLLDTHYLQVPLHNPNASEWTNDLLAAADWTIQENRIDLAAEIGICLQLAEQHQTDAYQMILNVLIREQKTDGSLQDLTIGISSTAHTTAAGLLFFAGAEEVQPV